MPRSPWPRSPWPRAATALASLLLLAACSGGGGGDLPDLPTPTPTQTSTATPTGTTDTPTSPTAAPTSPEPSDEQVAYVPWGPADPVVPQHYGDLARRDCDAAADSSPDDEFWAAVVAVCRSLTQGEPWPELSDVPEVPETDDPHEQCLDSELATMVSDALAWREEHPDTEPSATFAETGSLCYLTVYDARQVPADEDATGPSPGQVTVAVVVDSTYAVASASVDGATVPEGALLVSDRDPFNGVATVSIHVPAPAGEAALQVDLQMTEGGEPRGTVSTSVAVSAPEESPSLDPSSDPSALEAAGPADPRDS